nr:hypothetical protein [Tanacetum cinerariifolium]
MESKDIVSSCLVSKDQETPCIKSVKKGSLDSKTKDVHEIKYKMSKAKEKCMAYYRSLHSHLRVLSKEDLKGTRIEYGFKRAFMSLFGQDDESFTNKYFVEYTGIKVKHFRDTQIQHIGNAKKSIAKRACHKRQYDRKDTSSRSGNDVGASDANIILVYDEEPIVEFASKVDVKKDLSKPVTPYYFPKVKEPAFAKHHHVIAPGSSRNTPKNVSTLPLKESLGSNDRWKPTGRIFKTVGLRWIPTGNLFESCKSKSYGLIKDENDAYVMNEVQGNKVKLW